MSKSVQFSKKNENQDCVHFSRNEKNCLPSSSILYSRENLEEKIDRLVSSKYPFPNIQQSKQICKKIQSIKNLQDTILFLEKEKVRVDSYIYHQMLPKKAPWSCTKKLFQSIPDADKNVHLSTSFIKLAGRNGDFKAAKIVFEETKALNIANAFTYNLFIDAAGKNGDLKAATQAFEEAKSLEIADVITYSSFIDAAGKKGDLKAATESFNEAKSLKIANTITYNSFIDVAGKNGNLEAATKVFMEAK